MIWVMIGNLAMGKTFTDALRMDINNPKRLSASLTSCEAAHSDFDKTMPKYAPPSRQAAPGVIISRSTGQFGLDPSRIQGKLYSRLAMPIDSELHLQNLGRLRWNKADKGDILYCKWSGR